MKASFICPCCESKIHVHLSSVSFETEEGLKLSLYVTGVSVEKKEATPDATRVLKNENVRRNGKSKGFPAASRINSPLVGHDSGR